MRCLICETRERAKSWRDWAASTAVSYTHLDVYKRQTRTTLAGAARRVLSTSVTVTGTLLAIDAPVIASAGGANGRFFEQWAGVAHEHGLKPLWPAGQVDLERCV